LISSVAFITAGTGQALQGSAGDPVGLRDSLLLVLKHQADVSAASPAPPPAAADKFVELHGDRAGLDDPAIVCGIGSIDGKSFMFIGHQKGRNTKVRSSSPCTSHSTHSTAQHSSAAHHASLRAGLS
jgi:hypothetical protein